MAFEDVVTAMEQADTHTTVQIQHCLNSRQLTTLITLQSGYLCLQEIHPVHEGALRLDYDDALRKGQDTVWTIACQTPIGRAATDPLDGDECPFR